jgi:hypothetical protein
LYEDDDDDDGWKVCTGLGTLTMLPSVQRLSPLPLPPLPCLCPSIIMFHDHIVAMFYHWRIVFPGMCVGREHLHCPLMMHAPLPSGDRCRAIPGPQNFSHRHICLALTGHDCAPRPLPHPDRVASTDSTKSHHRKFVLCRCPSLPSPKQPNPTLSFRNSLYSLSRTASYSAITSSNLGASSHSA